MAEIDPSTAWWVGTAIAAVAAIVSAAFARHYQRKANQIATSAEKANATLEALARLPQAGGGQAPIYVALARPANWSQTPGLTS